MQEVAALVSALIADIDEAPIDEGSPRPVPSGKLSYNKLSPHWHAMIRSGSQNAHHVGVYLDRHPDPEIGPKVAQVFRERYAALKAQGLSPDVIMTELYQQITGVGAVRPEQQVAAQGLLAYLFDACDIFDEPPQEVAK